jgi:hypothetical protein
MMINKRLYEKPELNVIGKVNSVTTSDVQALGSDGVFGQLGSYPYKPVRNEDVRG